MNHFGCTLIALLSYALLKGLYLNVNKPFTITVKGNFRLYITNTKESTCQVKALLIISVLSRQQIELCRYILLLLETEKD